MDYKNDFSSLKYFIEQYIKNVLLKEDYEIEKKLLIIY